MVDYKKNFQVIAGSVAILTGGVAIVLGIASQIYLSKYHPVNEAIVSLQQPRISLTESIESLQQPRIDSYQHWWNTVQKELEFYELAEEKGGAIGAFVEIAKRRGLVEIVECGDDSLSDFKNTKK